MEETVLSVVFSLSYSSYLALSFNQPKFCPTASWNPSAITFANQSIVGVRPTSIFVNTNNTIYVTNQANNTILVWDEDSGNLTNIISDDFISSNSLFVTVNGDLFIDDGQNNSRVQKWIATTNRFVTVMKVNASCYGLFFDRSENLYCSIYNQHRVVKGSLTDGDTALVTVVAGTGVAGPASNELYQPLGIFVDVNMFLYVADCGNDRVQLFQSRASTGITVAGSGSPHPTINLDCPSAIVLDSERYLFIVDTWSHRIVGSGVNGFRCLVGCYGAGSQSNQLRGPMSFSFDRSGNMFVNDRFNHRIQKFMHVESCLGKLKTKYMIRISLAFSPFVQ